MRKSPAVPESVFWHSIPSAMDSCTEYSQLENIVLELKQIVPPLKPRNMDAKYSPPMDKIDMVAQSEIPPDGPVSLKVVSTTGDGNCLPRSVRYVHHVELRARVVMEGVTNKDKYLSDDCLERGASFVHGNADLPTVFATFSEFYTPGQKLTKDAIECIYCLEMHSCAHLGSYMGLWQLAQFASVLKTPIHTIYPVHGTRHKE